MCVIIASPDSKHRPSLETLLACEQQNPHGSGLAWVQHRKAQWVKGLSAESIHDLLGVLEGPVVIHFRIATVGGKRTSLCHPFAISPTSPLKSYGQAGTVLFHNGHWCGWEEFAKAAEIELRGPVSDSRVIAAGVHRFGKKLLNRVEGSRFALFGREGYKLYGEWSEIDGVHFSNLCWRPREVEPEPEAETAAEKEFPRRRLSLFDEAMACFGE